MDGEELMDKDIIESYVEKYLNGGTLEKFPVIKGILSAKDRYLYNTAKRLLVAGDKFSAGKAGKDVFLIALRNYLLSFQTEMFLKNETVIHENEYGIYTNAAGKIYVTLDLPDYLDSKFVELAFHGNNARETGNSTEGIFYGTNAFIHKLTGHKQFKSLEQKFAVFGALNTPDGYTTLVALPTGGGKSLVTQTMAYQNKGLTIVVVPTVSLAIDQVRNAKINIKSDTASAEIFCYYGGMPGVQKDELKEAIRKETARLVFISPEALIRNKEFKNLIKAANDSRFLKNLIIDEAHIVIEWGDFFRVDYQCLEAWRNELMTANSQLRTVLLSATFTRSAVASLKQMFSVPDKWIEIRCDALRKEPRFILVKSEGFMDKRKKMLELVKKLPHPMVVYVNSPDDAENIRSFLSQNGIDSLETFTGKTKSAQREQIIKDWSEDKIDLIIATSAFGVGVDKGDVRTVLHSYVPNTPNQYYQELGRGGRDGLISLSVMCITPKDDVDLAYKRMGKVLSPEKIWGRWLSMYKDPTSSWFKGTVTLNTDVKPTYNVTAGDDDASDIDIQWNIYVILLLRRHNLLLIRDMIFSAGEDGYKIRIEILDDTLRNETIEPPQIIKDIRDRESEGFEKEIKRIRNSIYNDKRMCWSEMFYSTYDKVSVYCGGCRNHEHPERMETDKFPLLIPIREPLRDVSAEFRKMCQGENEAIVIGDTEDYSLLNKFLNAGANVVVVADTAIEENFDLMLNMTGKNGVMIMGVKEYRELASLPAEYYLSGGVVALYNTDAKGAYEFCTALRKYRKNSMRLVHITGEDYFVPKAHKSLTAMVDGPRIDSYILERM